MSTNIQKALEIKLTKSDGIGKRLVVPMINEILLEEWNRLQKRLKDITTENQALGGTMNAFRYDGRLRGVVPLASLRGMKVKDLHPSLCDTFQYYLENVEQLQSDMAKIRCGLSVALVRCKTKQNVRDMLPDAVVTHIADLRGIDRMNPEGFLLQDTPVLQEQFSETVNLILDYMTRKLLL